MPAELVPAFVVLFLIGLGAGGVELRNALRPPVCPRCIHCKHEALARQERAERDSRIRWPARSEAHDRDDDSRPRR
jgi:hypothetical protein